MTEPVDPKRGNTDSDRWSFSLLGTVRAWRDREEVDLGTPQERLVLAILVSRSGKPVSAQMLIDALWEDRPPARALGTVRTYVSRLRQRLEPDRSGGPARLLVSVTGGYALRIDPDAVDVHRFDEFVRQAETAATTGDHMSATGSLRAALALWGTEPWAGLPGTYAEGRRRQLIERRTAVAELRFASELALGRHREILDDLAAHAAAHPERERPQEQWMLALYKSGRQAEALDVYRRTREFLNRTLGVRPGRELEDLHARVLSGDVEPPGEAAGPQPQLQPQPEPKPGQGDRILNQPMQLPGDIAGFTGRKAELDEVRGAIVGPAAPRDQRAVVVVTGIGGVGKSTLAIRAAHSVRHHFPDGQLYTDLRGVDDEPADPEQVLHMFLRALGIPGDEIPVDVEDAAELFRATLEGRKVLVVLDNARDAGQLRPLVARGSGSGGSATIITSRWRLTDLEVTRAVALDVLQPSEAASMFAEIVGKQRVAKEPEAAAELLAAGGNLPLSVRILAARLVARPAWTIASLTDRLAGERHRLDELSAGELAVSATFHLSFAQLDKEQQRACRLLALYGGPALVPEIAAALLNTTPDQAIVMCTSLVEAGLLDEPVHAGYRFHDLVRLFAKRRADLDSPGESIDAGRRLLDFYLATGKRVLRVIQPHGGRPDRLASTTAVGRSFETATEARAWLSAEADGIVAACRLAGDGLVLAAELTIVLDLACNSRAVQQRVLSLVDDLVDVAAEREDRYSEAVLRITRASVLEFIEGDTERAVQELQLARTAALDGGYDYECAETETDLGTYLIEKQEYDLAVEYLESALARHRRLGNRHDEAVTLSTLSEVLAHLGRIDAALDAVSRSVEIHRDLGWSYGEAIALVEAANVRRIAGEPGGLQTALRELDLAYGKFQALGAEVWIAKNLTVRAALLLELGDPAGATEAAESALAVHRESGFKADEGRTLAVLGHASDRTGDAGRARILWQEAYDILGPLGVQEAETLATLLHLETAGYPSG